LAYSADLIRRMRASKPAAWDGIEELTPNIAERIIAHARDWIGDCIRTGAMMARWGEDEELQSAVDTGEILTKAWVSAVQDCTWDS
jgi:hypothetical protein